MALRAALTESRLQAFAKTSGGAGLHVYRLGDLFAPVLELEQRLPEPL